MSRRFALPGFLAVLVLGLVALSGVACSTSDSDLPVIEATLVAPPNVPPPITRARAHVVVRLETMEKVVEIAPGVTYKVWSFNGTVPGPMVRVREGDIVEVHLMNHTDSTVTHNIDLHAVNGPGGGAGATNVAPGEEKSFTFKAMAPGLYVYHCAAGLVADHIANGMYGAILVEPAERMAKVDHEWYIGQSEFYTKGATGDAGLQTQDTQKLLDETPTYVVWNGNTKSLTGDGALKATVGQSVRLYVSNGGPNLISSFHVIGEIFDKAWNFGGFNEPLHDIQTVLVPAGGASMVEFKVDVPGDYKLVDHALSRVAKGAAGTLTVTGAQNPGIFNAGANATAAASHDMTPVATATATATQAPSGPATTVKLTMKDNLFDPKTVSVNAGSKVTFDLPNEGQIIHNMKIADASGSFTSAQAVTSQPEFVSPGKSGTLTWQAPNTPGTYNFRCEVHPTEMTGTITVK